MGVKFARKPGDIDGGYSPVSGRKLVVRQYLWDQIIDFMLGEPGITLLEISRRMNHSPNWVSTITHSDAFKDLLRTRRAEFNADMNTGLNEALTRVAKKGIELLETKLENPAGIAPALALEVVDRTLERLGYGVKSGPAVAVTNIANSMVLSREDFEHAKSLVHAHKDLLPALETKPEIEVEDIEYEEPELEAVPRSGAEMTDTVDVVASTLKMLGVE